MLVTELGIVISDKLLHSENAPVSILVTELGIDTSVRLLQPLNNLTLIEAISRSKGKLIVFSEEQSLNASRPKYVTELGMKSVVKLEQPQKALFPIDLTEFGISREPISPLQPENA